MINPYDIEELELNGQPIHPPGISFGLVTIPIIERISPVLAVFIEIIGRNAFVEKMRKRHLLGTTQAFAKPLKNRGPRKSEDPQARKAFLPLA